MKFDRPSLACYFAAIVLGAFYGCYRAQYRVPFDSEKWKSLTKATDGDKREAMVADLLANHSPVGLSCEDAESLLGSDYYKMQWKGEDVWFYDLGDHNTVTLIRSARHKLMLTIENGRVTEAGVHVKK